MHLVGFHYKNIIFRIFTFLRCNVLRFGEKEVSFKNMNLSPFEVGIFLSISVDKPTDIE